MVMPHLRHPFATDSTLPAMTKRDRFEARNVVPVSFLLVTTAIATLATAPSVPLSATPPTAHLHLGTVRGTLSTYKTGKQYQAFRGIPYAEPPIGDLRFAKPLPHPGFESVFNASQYGRACPQGLLGPLARYNEKLYSEDCLTLNVFVPVPSDTAAASVGRVVVVAVVVVVVLLLLLQLLFAAAATVLIVVVVFFLLLHHSSCG